MEAAPFTYQTVRAYLLNWADFFLKHPENGQNIPPIHIIRYKDILADVWGWDRLMPHQAIDLGTYRRYLDDYLRHNDLAYIASASAGKINPEEWPLKAAAAAPPVEAAAAAATLGGNLDGLVAAAVYCLRMETEFISEWKSRVKSRVRNVKNLSRQILERVRRLIESGEGYNEPAAAALVCIAKEAALACELLRRGAKGTDDEIELCNYIRQCALSLMDTYKDSAYATSAAAVMMGVAKEAKLMLEWMRDEDECYVYRSYHPFHKVGNCDRIRVRTLSVMEQILEKTTTGNDVFLMMDFGKKVKNRKQTAKLKKGASQMNRGGKAADVKAAKKHGKCTTSSKKN